MIENESLPASADDVPAQGPSEQELLDAVMANSPIMDEAAPPPLPAEEEELEVPDEVEEEETAETESVSEDDEEVTEEAEEEGEDDTSTQNPDAYALDELDDFAISVKIDGEETAVNIADLVKGYATEQSLTRKGRELGEARKALDEERAEKLGQIEHIAETTAAMLTQTEQAFASQYKDLEQKIQKARDEGDTYELGELKDKREQAQERYWSVRRRREGMMEAVAQQKQEIAQQQWVEQMQYFQEQIPELVPGFDEKMAGDIRDFAMEEGLSTDVIDSIVDPVVVKMLNDYRVLKQGVSKGAEKRKAVPTKKAVPVKKPVPAKKKAEDAAKMVKARAFREDASEEDRNAFLRQYASRSLNL